MVPASRGVWNQAPLSPCLPRHNSIIGGQDLGQAAKETELSDIFSEVDEDLKRDEWHKYWEAYGSWVIGAALAIVVLVAGGQYWQHYQAGKQQALSEQYLAAYDLMVAGKTSEALDAFEAIAHKTTSGYKAMAMLQKGAVLVEAGRVQEAVDLYDELAARGTGDPILRDLAKVRAGWALADSASFDDLNARVATLADSDSAFALSAQELLAYAALRNGDVDEARIRYGGLVNNIYTPNGMRQRASAMLTVMGPAETPVETLEAVPSEEIAPGEAPVEDTASETAPTEE
ncbi:MAG: tetratricopeptide repeat protein [Alphaproteobacteria bacterium]|nr:MAG: tetratricopeptide repeat protein [Alphaproteobacteria bacterium]